MQQPVTPANPAFHFGSIALALVALVMVLQFDLLVALLATCSSYALATHLPHTWLLRKAGRRAHLLSTIAVAAVPVLALVAFGLALSYLTSHAGGAYAEVIEKLNDLILQWRGKLPDALASRLPSGPETIKPWLSALVNSQSDTLATVGKSGAHGFLTAFLGVVIGLLMAGSHKADAPGAVPPLSKALRDRARHVQGTFEQVVRAQLWIALINTTFTAIFFYVVLPLMGAWMPYAPALLILTFFAGLLPVVGNLVCNTVTTLVALSVSPLVAGAALIFLIVVHKAEYFINAKVIGSRMSMAPWELVVAMFVAEALFGAGGLVAATLFYPYLKLELRQLGWV